MKGLWNSEPVFIEIRGGWKPGNTHCFSLIPECQTERLIPIKFGRVTLPVIKRKLEWRRDFATIFVYKFSLAS